MISYILVKTQSESVSILEKVKQDESLQNFKELSIDKGSEKMWSGNLVYLEEAAFKLRKGEITTSHLRQNLDLI